MFASKTHTVNHQDMFICVSVKEGNLLLQSLLFTSIQTLAGRKANALATTTSINLIEH
jgi:hypothetical protein